MPLNHVKMFKALYFRQQDTAVVSALFALVLLVVAVSHFVQMKVWCWKGSSRIGFNFQHGFLEGGTGCFFKSRRIIHVRTTSTHHSRTRIALARHVS